MSEFEPWQMDFSPPMPGDQEQIPFALLWKNTFAKMKLNFNFDTPKAVGYDPVLDKPFSHDRPTNLVYPTSTIINESRRPRR